MDNTITLNLPQGVWNEVVVGEKETIVSSYQEFEWWISDTAPTGAVVGHPNKSRTPLPLRIPFGKALYIYNRYTPLTVTINTSTV